MMAITDAWRAGYRSGQEPSNELLRAIEPPETYTPDERGDFISGFLSGARAARDRELIDEMTKAIAEPDPRDPDHSRPGIFAAHNCWKCNSGAKPCVNGSPRRCDYPHARND